MASGFFALFDDIATLMDDVASLSKITTRKTAGLLADDLAVNAEKASGFVAARELPILWEITKGSFINKLIILPIAFLLSAFFPEAITPVLLIGGIYLAYEGAEKIYTYFFHRKKNQNIGISTTLTKEEIASYEKKKIKSAILVDFILSIEIIMIALGTVVEEKLLMQVIVVSIVAVLATVGVYGLVALLVRMDDLGYKLIEKSEDESDLLAKAGRILVKTLPIIVRGLAILGTIAMLLVAGGIFMHNLSIIHDNLHFLPTIIAELICGFIVGLVALFIINGIKMLVKS